MSYSVFPQREKLVFITGFPDDENRFFPVRKSTQGKPCFHYREGFAVCSFISSSVLGRNQVWLKDISTPDFSTPSFNPESCNPGLVNHKLFKPRLFSHEFLNEGVEKFTVKKSGVEKSGFEMSSYLLKG